MRRDVACQLTICLLASCSDDGALGSRHEQRRVSSVPVSPVVIEAALAPKPRRRVVEDMVELPPGSVDGCANIVCKDSRSYSFLETEGFEIDRDTVPLGALFACPACVAIQSPDHAIEHGISEDMARAYCRARGARLPDAYELERAVRELLLSYMFVDEMIADGRRMELSVSLLYDDHGTYTTAPSFRREPIRGVPGVIPDELPSLRFRCARSRPDLRKKP